MKVKNNGRIVWPKGMELAKDLPAGDVGAVNGEAENSERLRSAIDSGVLEVVAELTHVVTPGGIVQTVAGDDSFASLTGSGEAIGPRKSGEVRRSSNQAPVEEAQKVLSELDEFKRRKGGAKVKFVQSMTDVEALRTILKISKGVKVLAAVQARIEVVVGVAKTPEELLGQAGQSAEEQVEKAENRLSTEREFTPNQPKTPEELSLNRQPKTPEDLIN